MMKDNTWRRVWIISVVLLSLIAFWSLAKSMWNQSVTPTFGKKVIDAPRDVTSSNHSSALVSVDSKSEQIRRFLEDRERDPAMEWKFPINFWGKVVDQNDRPLEGARIRFLWNDLSPSGTSEHTTTSDVTGEFSMINRKGKGLSVWVEKEGYYNFPGSRNDFEYARPDQRFYPDPKSPIVFRLKRAGKLEPLVGYSVILPLPNNGGSVEFDFLKGRWIEPGVIKFECSVGLSDDQTRRHDWSFKVSMPSGGLQVRQNILDFEAPEFGYTNVISRSERQDSTNWTARFKGDFFVKFGDPVRYGRVEIDFSPQRIEYYKNSSVSLKYWVNPSGSRNLEISPAKWPQRIPSEYLRKGIPNQSLDE